MVVNNDILIPQIAELLRQGKIVEFTPRGQSMMPTIVGDVDSVVLARPTKLKKRDMVLARVTMQDAECWVLHRIVDVNGEQLTLKGDNNPHATETCTKKDVAGKVIKVHRRSPLHYWWRRVRRFWRCKMQDAECTMQNAKCRMLNAEC